MVDSDDDVLGKVKPKKRKIEHIKCSGIFESREQCNRNVTFVGDYCTTHQYFLNFTEADIEDIESGEEKFKVCGRCKHWHNGKNVNCVNCVEKTINGRRAKRTKEITCAGKARSGNNCSRKPVDGSDFCENHSYMHDYTEDMLENLTKCSGCNMMYYFGDGQLTCTGCKTRKKNATIQHNVDIANGKVDMCKHPDCKYMACSKSTYTDFCGKHQAYGWKKSVELDDDVIACRNFIRGCRNTMQADEGFTSCLPCRVKERAKDLKLRDKAKQCKIQKDAVLTQVYPPPKPIIVVDNDDNDDDIVDDLYEITEDEMMEDIKQVEKEYNLGAMRMCITCPKSSNVHPLEMFIGFNGNECMRCSTCRHKDSIRAPRKRNWKAEIDANPERKAKKEQWKKDNHDKMLGYWQSYRVRSRSAMGDEAYRKMIAENTKKYRTAHPEVMAAIYDTKKKNDKRKHYDYVRSACVRDVDWNLTYEDCKTYFETPCYYCNFKSDKGYLNGIDRRDNCVGYSKDNCVACCEMCNVMKCKLDDKIFILRCRHILSRHGIIPELWGDANIFDNYTSFTYAKTKYSATQRTKEFELTPNMFKLIKSMSCYICGKQSSSFHKNGIDRVNNNVGYLYANCFSCCANCNYMKKNLSLGDFLCKLYAIYVEQFKCDKEFSDDEIHNLANLICTITKNTYIIMLRDDNTESMNDDENDSKHKPDNININDKKNYTKLLKERTGDDIVKRIQNLRKTMQRKRDNVKLVAECRTELDKLLEKVKTTKVTKAGQLENDRKIKTEEKHMRKANASGKKFKDMTTEEKREYYRIKKYNKRHGIKDDD
jgi:hypothetical protein